MDNSHEEKTPANPNITAPLSSSPPPPPLPPPPTLEELSNRIQEEIGNRIHDLIQQGGWGKNGEDNEDEDDNNEDVGGGDFIEKAADADEEEKAKEEEKHAETTSVDIGRKKKRIWHIEDTLEEEYFKALSILKYEFDQRDCHTIRFTLSNHFQTDLTSQNQKKMDKLR